MRSCDQPRIGYVLKMYPRFSETFIVNEILAHEAAGIDLEIFSLKPPLDGRFHESLAHVRAPVTYLKTGAFKGATVWAALNEASAHLPGLWDEMTQLVRVDVDDAMHAVELACHVRNRAITHLHAHFGSVATTVARLAASIAGISYSFTAHAKDIFHEDVDPADLAAKLREAASVVTVSDFNLSYLRSQYGAAAANAVRIYNGLDLERFPYRAPIDRPPVVVAVGRLVEKKGFPVLIDACRFLRRAGHRFRCRIVGTGPLEDELRVQIEAGRLEGCVELAGPRPQEEVRGIVGNASVLAAPCVIATDGNRDGLPTVLLEAMALGTPCVATDVTGIPEIVKHGQTGLLVPQRDAHALADSMASLLDEAELRTSLASSARSMIEKNFDIHRQAETLRQEFTVSLRPRLEAVRA
jgi:colanic acid/amylovoran biosynthesis glycosyltransferase